MPIAVIGDELPDFGEIRLGAMMENNQRHGLSALGSSTTRGLALAPVLLDLLRAPWDGWPADQTFLDVGAQLLQLHGPELILLSMRRKASRTTSLAEV